MPEEQLPFSEPPGIWERYRHLYGQRNTDLPVIPALQSLVRQGRNPLDIVDDPQLLLATLDTFTTQQVSSEEELRPESKPKRISLEETLKADFAAIRKKLERLETINRPDDVNGLDRKNFQLYKAQAEALMEELLIVKDPLTIKELQAKLRNNVVNAIYAQILKKIPRFYLTPEGKLIVDTESIRWSPSAYILNNALPVLAGWLKDRDIIDPFAGPGSLMNFLSANEIPRSVVYSDILYPYRRHPESPQTSNYYAPEINALMHQFMFHDLPLWCQPELTSRIKHTDHFDATDLPYDSQFFDLICSDPPYGVNLDNGDLDFFLETLPGLLEISRIGGIFLVPMRWTEIKLKERIPQLQELTGDLSSGFSQKIPTQIIYIPRNAFPQPQ